MACSEKKYNETNPQHDTYEAITSAFACLPIRNDDCLLDVPINVEMLPKTFIRGMIR